MQPLAGRTMVISGASRGIGLAIARRAAAAGANVCLIAKTGEPDPRLPGTVFTAAAEIEQAGGHALPLVGDVRDEDRVREAVAECVERFGGIDVCVNNASAIDLSPARDLSTKRYDLMQDVNVRGMFVLTQACVPHLERSPNPHVLSLSPPLNLGRAWLGAHPAYTLAKYGMSLLTLGFAEELREAGVAVNSLWPRTMIATSAVANVVGAELVDRARRPEIVADAAHVVLGREAAACTGQLLVDEEVLRAQGLTDFSAYAPQGVAEADLAVDIFVDAHPVEGPTEGVGAA